MILTSSTNNNSTCYIPLESRPHIIPKSICRLFVQVVALIYCREILVPTKQHLLIITNSSSPTNTSGPAQCFYMNELKRKGDLRFTNRAVVTAVRLQHLAAVTEPDSWRQEDDQLNGRHLRCALPFAYFLKPRSSQSALMKEIQWLITLSLVL